MRALVGRLDGFQIWFVAKALVAIAAIAFYFVTASWVEKTYVPDLAGPPPGAGIRVRLFGPFAPLNEFSVTTGELKGIFQQYADRSESDDRSPIELWEGNQRLGPAHSTLSEVVSVGRGRFLHRVARTQSEILFASSDNSNPMTNGRTYWVVNPARP